MTVVFAPQEAAETGDEPDHLTQWGRGLRGLCTVGDDPSGLPFFRVEDPLAGEIRAFSPPGDEVKDTPGDDQIDHQGTFHPFQCAQLERFDPATGFQNEVCQIFCVNAVLVS